MKKFFVFVFLVLSAIFLSGLYGIIHDQISYTVSPEYFIKFKFQQFGIAEMNLPDRVRASMVGFLASWWMGIPIGLLVGGSGFVHIGYQRMLKVSLMAFGLVIAITILFGACGLLYGYFQTNTIDLAKYHGWFIPNGVVNLRRFLCVGYMHDASYLGGTLSIYIACIFQVFIRIKDASR
ncbi:MAG: signal peptide-containing protein [Limisphaerales bacterium]